MKASTRDAAPTICSRFAACRGVRVEAFMAMAPVLPAWSTGGWASANLKNAHCSAITGLCDGPGSTGNGASRNSGWYAGGGFDYMVHRGALVDVVLGVEYQHFDVSASPAFCVNPGCAVASVRDFDLSARGDLVRARLTIKTQGYRL